MRRWGVSLDAMKERPDDLALRQCQWKCRDHQVAGAWPQILDGHHLGLLDGPGHQDHQVG